jgi:DnaD/phage-associated family protein
MEHSFNVEAAKTIGIEGAILLKNIWWWCEKNAANEQNIHDGKAWTYNSIKAYKDLFPYMTEKKIRSTLKKLEEDGLIETGNYNKMSYDRTLWYAITGTGKDLLGVAAVHLPNTANANAQKGKSILPNGQMDFTEKANGFTQKGEPIPNINSNINSNDIPQQEEADGWQTVIHLYENNIRPLTSRIELDKLYSLYTDYGQMWLSAAITEAVENGAHNIKYIAAILDRWKVDGFKADRRAKKTQAKKETAPPENPNIRDGIDWSRFDG